MEKPIKRAIISVFDKTGVVDFARQLQKDFGVEILSTGGTAKTLQEAGIPIKKISDFTNLRCSMAESRPCIPKFTAESCAIEITSPIIKAPKNMELNPLTWFA